MTIEPGRRPALPRLMPSTRSAVPAKLSHISACLLIRTTLFVVSLIAFGGLIIERVTAQTFPTNSNLQYFAGDNLTDTVISRAGEKFKINGIFTYAGRIWNDNPIEGLLLNARMVNGVYDVLDGDLPEGMKPWDPLQNTKDFIAQMPNWRAQGLVAFGINLQGGSNRCNGISGEGQSSRVNNNPYGSSGTQAFEDWYANRDTAQARYLARLGSIIRAADDLGMVVILGLFYFGQDELLADETAVISAVEAVTDWLLDNKWTNVVIEINNEADIFYEHAILRANRVHELMQRVKMRSAGAHLPHGRLLVSNSGSGGYIPSDTWISNSDLVLLHGNAQVVDGIKSMVDQVVHRSSWQADPKPIVFNEDSTRTQNFVGAVEEYASWGYYDDDGYQCVHNTLTADRWTLEKSTNPGYWHLLAKMTRIEDIPPGTVRMEADKLNLSGGYEVDPQNPEWITLESSASQGQASGIFAGPSGEYQITFHVIAENDGRPSLDLWVGGVLKTVFSYPLGTTSREMVIVSGPKILINSGDQIRLVGRKDTSALGTAHARVDELRFTLISPTSSPPPGTGMVTLEAENMRLSGGYEIDPTNREWIMVSSSVSQGEAAAFFPGSSGEYQVRAHVIAEDDGHPNLELWVGGVLRKTFTYPLGVTSREPVILVGPTLTVTSGVEIRLVGIKHSGIDGESAHARIDALVFEQY